MELIIKSGSLPTGTGFFVNHEAGIITEDQHLIKPAMEYYNRLYDDAGEQRTTS